MADYFVLALCFLYVDGVSGDEVSVMEGDSVSLHTGVTRQHHDKMLWYFNDTRIALINGDASKSCLYDGEGGIFRDRLEVDYESGSLTITEVRPEHTGRYEAELIRSESSGTSQSLNRNSKCDSTKITRKTSNLGDSIKTFSVTVSGADVNLERNLFESQSDRSSGQSPAAVAGARVPVLLGLCLLQRLLV